MSENKRSPLPRPSSAERWIAGGCRRSPRLEARYPENTSFAAEDGTRLHDLAAGVLRGGPRAYNEDDASVVDPYVDDVLSERDKRPNAKLFVEIETWWKWLADLRGTPDAVLVDWTNKHVIIWDLKTGWRIVEAIGNWQLTCYAIFHAREGWTHELRIVQPKPWHRDGPIRSWTMSYEQIVERSKKVKEAFEEALRPDAPLRPGAHCLYCDAMAGCPAARQVSLSAIEMVAAEPDDLPNSEIGTELRILRETLKILELRVGALEEETAARIRAGQSVDGVFLRENPRGARWKWNGNEQEIRSTLMMLTGKDPAVPKLPTPKQLRDNGVAEELLRPFTFNQPGKLVVSTEADELAKKVFGDLPNMEHVKK